MVNGQKLLVNVLHAEVTVNNKHINMTTEKLNKFQKVGESVHFGVTICNKI